VETQLFITNTLVPPSVIQQINFQIYDSLQFIHRFLFQELYT